MKEILQLPTVILGLLILGPTLLVGQVSNPQADSAINAFNNAFLTTVDGKTYYKDALNVSEPDGTWTLALDIQGMLDAYERTGSAAHKALIDDLVTSFLLINPPPYDWDGWNDDLAWMALVLIRGYEMIGKEEFLTAAESTFHLAYDRGWNTEFNDGGIWEQQPNYTDDVSGKIKEALSNNPMGQLACMLYTSTGDEYYLEKAKQIYEWSVSHIFNPENGHVYGGVYRNGYLNKGMTAYNQGTFIDFSTLLYELTGDERTLRNAVLAANFTINHLTTDEGIISNDADYLDTWAGEFGRGLGHLVKSNPELWNKYYPFLKRNSDAAWSNRRMDLNLTWNAWDTPTPESPDETPTKYVSAVAIIQHTPTTQLITSTIEAEDYNFWKGTTEVDIEAAGEGVQLTNDGDWLEYIIKIPEAGNYTIAIDVAATEAGSLDIQQNHFTLATVDIPITGDFQNYSSIRAAVSLKAGIQSIRFKALNGGWNMDKWTATGCDLIEPYVSVNGASEDKVSEIEMNKGDNILLSPQPYGGTWSWVGPGGFTSASRLIEINDIQLNQGGAYTAHYKNAEGCISRKDFLISINECTPMDINITAYVNEGEWVQANEIIKAGSFVKISGTPSEGTWNWTGPNGFYADTREIVFINIDYSQAGDYTATYLNANGCITSETVSITLNGDDPCSSPIIPYINTNGWENVAYASISQGETFTVGPQPTDGDWIWVGPNGFTSNAREFTVTDFNESKAGYYTATHTNAQGCESSIDFIISLEGCGETDIIPRILVGGVEWDDTEKITVASGSGITITPPDLPGIWRWKGSYNSEFVYEGANGFSSDSRVLSFDSILDVRKGTYTLMYIDDSACISTYHVDVEIIGDDYCGTPITPYIQINNGDWEIISDVTLDAGGTVSFGPQPLGRYNWSWEGPAGFMADTREYTLSDVQVEQSGVYHAICTNNVGCRSYMDFIISVNGDSTANPEVLGVDGHLLVSPYPNPAIHTVRLNDLPAGTSITISDMNGRVLKKVESNDRGDITAIDVHDLQSGVYLINIGSQGKAFKLLKR